MVTCFVQVSASCNRGRSTSLQLELAWNLRYESDPHVDQITSFCELPCACQSTERLSQD